MSDIIIKGYLCDRCGYQWPARGDKRPVRCAKCKNPYWDTPRRERRGTINWLDEMAGAPTVT